MMAIAWLLLAAVAQSVQLAQCMPSRQCLSLVNQELDKGGMRCHDSPCGSLVAQEIGMTFTERLSDSCKAKMAEFRLGRKGDGRLIQKGPRYSMRCAARHGSANPTNPVVMQTENSAPFVICTIPKVACTNIRKLLRVLIKHPDSLPEGADEQMWPAHFSTYPTLWHYDHLSATIDDHMPGFILGRNPCAPGSMRGAAAALLTRIVRVQHCQRFGAPWLAHCLHTSSSFANACHGTQRCMHAHHHRSHLSRACRYVRILSCHLDKMVLDPNRGHDWSTLNQINAHLRQDINRLYEATLESFAAFVRQVQAHGPLDINEHLKLQARPICCHSWTVVSLSEAARKLYRSTEAVRCFIASFNTRPGQCPRCTLPGWRTPATTHTPT